MVGVEFTGPVVRAFDAHNRFPVGAGSGGGARWIKTGHYLFGGAHAGPGNVDVGQDADRRAIDDAFPEVIHLLPAGGAGIDAGSHAFLEKMGVGMQGVGPGTRHQIAGVVGVQVHVDEAGGYEEAAEVDAARGLPRGDLFGYAGNLAVFDTDVAAGVDLVGRIDEVAAFEDQVQLVVFWHGILPLNVMGFDGASKSEKTCFASRK